MCSTQPGWRATPSGARIAGAAMVLALMAGGCTLDMDASPAGPGALEQALGGDPPVLQAVWTLDEEAGLGFEGQTAYCDLDGDGQVEALVPIPIAQGGPDISYIDVIDPVSGQRVFRTAAGEGGFPQPACDDVNGDGVLDILVSGRIGDIRALSGVDGSRLWSLRENHPSIPIGNAYTPVSAPELPGLYFVTMGGGGGLGTPRNPGSLLVFTSQGELLAQWDDPDGAEVYSSPAVIARDFDLPFSWLDNVIVVFGSGGETLPGSLHYLRYHVRSRRFHPIAEIPSSCETGGFLGSPVIGNVFAGPRPEVVAVDFCGSVFATTLRGHEIWRRSTTLPYALTNPLLTDLDGNGRYDVVVVGNAVNPSLPETYFLLDGVMDAYRGSNGATLWSQALDLPVFSSPVSADANGDGVEDIWFATFHLAVVGEPLPSSFHIHSGVDGAPLHSYGNVNWAGTPVLGDGDGDGDIDAPVIDGPVQFGVFLPTQSKLLELTGVPYDPNASYSGFRGSNRDGYRR